jgi:chorismate mutase
METKVNTVKQLRRYIEETDKELMTLLDRRYRLSMRVGSIKASEEVPVHDPDREAEVTEKAIANVKDMPQDMATGIYLEILKRLRAESQRLNENDG